MKKEKSKCQIHTTDGAMCMYWWRHLCYEIATLAPYLLYILLSLCSVYWSTFARIHKGSFGQLLPHEVGPSLRAKVEVSLDDLVCSLVAICSGLVGRGRVMCA